MRISFWSGLLLLFAVAACQSDSKDAQYEETLIGRWEVREALRNGRPTETLTGAFMEFRPDGRMFTNINGTPDESAFSLKDNVISSKSQRLPVDYLIQYAGDSSLVLKFSMGNFSFQLTLTPSPADAPTEE